MRNSVSFSLTGCKFARYSRFRIGEFRGQPRIFFERDRYKVEPKQKVPDQDIERLFIWLGQYLSFKGKQTPEIQSLKTAHIHTKMSEKEIKKLIAMEVQRQLKG
jgi:hypothetical protein